MLQPELNPCHWSTCRALSYSLVLASVWLFSFLLLNSSTNAPTTVIRAPVIVHPTTRPLPLAPITVQPVQPVTVVRKTQTRSLPARKTVKPFHPTAPVVKKTKPVPAATVLEGKAQIIAVATAFAAIKKKEKQLIKVPIIQPMIVPPPPALPAGTVNEG